MVRGYPLRMTATITYEQDGDPRSRHKVLLDGAVVGIYVAMMRGYWLANLYDHPAFSARTEAGLRESIANHLAPPHRRQEGPGLGLSL